MRKYVTYFLLTFIFSLICILFYRMQWVYGLPTPVPNNYREVSLGTMIDISSLGRSVSEKPLFIHFFNPDCPCSKFNIPHFKSLVKEYSDRVNFIIVPLNAKADVTKADIEDKFDLKIPIVMDSSIARTCGVYSTPQAVIIAPDNKLFYRGNYNRSRYCSDKKSEYARLALEGFLNPESGIVFDELALRAYGCKLPVCTTK